MKVEWSRPALAQLRAAHAYIAKDNPRAAADFLAALRKLENNLGAVPHMGHPTNQPGVFEFLLGASAIGSSTN